MSIFKRESLFALLAASVFIGGCGGGGGGGNGGGSSTGGSGSGNVSTPGGPISSPLAVNFNGLIRPIDNQVTNALVNFDGETTNGTEPLTFQWDFGDGTTASTKAAPHRFTQAGAYQVKLTVTDANGQTASKTMPWRVSNVSMRFVAGDTDGSHHINGTATQARFNQPTGVAITNSGIIYVAEPETAVIRKVLADGTTSDFAGAAYAPGTSDGNGPNARFRAPKSVAVDGAGNVYVVDDSTSIRKITPAGQVTTVASLKSATGDIFRGVAVSQDGIVYVLSDSRILKVSNGEFVEFVGKLKEPGQVDGSAAIARLNQPQSITVGPDNNVYVLEPCRDVRKITPSGVVSSVKKTNITSSTQCSISDSEAIAVNTDGQIFRTEWTQVQLLDAQGNWIAYAGQNTGTYSSDLNGDRSTATFRYLRAIASGPSGELLVTGSANTLRKISAAGQVTTVAGTDRPVNRVNADQTEFSYGSRVARYDSGLMVATDGNCVRTLKFGQFAGTLAGDCLNPGYNNIGMWFNARFTGLYGIAVDQNLNVFVTERDSHRIRKIDRNQNVTDYAGTGAYGNADGSALSATFAYPSYLAVDSANNLWVTTQGQNALLRKISPGGIVSTVSIAQYCDGSCSIEDIVADTNGSVFIVTGNTNLDKILKIAANGQISQLFPANGSSIPYGVRNHRLAIDPQGRLLLTNVPFDDGFYRLQRIDTTTGASTDMATFKSFVDQVFVGQPEIEFTRAIEGAAFNSDGSLMMLGGGTAFQASGLQ